MRAALTTVRVLASLVYCFVGFVGCVIAFLAVWGLIAGVMPLGGVFAHGNVPLPSLSWLLWMAALLAPLIGCDIYFRATKRYSDSDDNKS